VLPPRPGGAGAPQIEQLWTGGGLANPVDEPTRSAEQSSLDVPRLLTIHAVSTCLRNSVAEPMGDRFWVRDCRTNGDG